MTKKEEGYGVAIVQSKSKPHPDGNAETGHCKTCAQITTNFNELRRCSTEDWAKLFHNNMKDMKVIWTNNFLYDFYQSIAAKSPPLIYQMGCT